MVRLVNVNLSQNPNVESIENKLEQAVKSQDGSDLDIRVIVNCIGLDHSQLPLQRKIYHEL